MKIDNVSFPYPVLGVSDDIRPTLEETGCENPCIEVSALGDEDFEISVELQLKNEDIQKYIQDGYAEYSVEVSCVSTLFRICKSSREPNFSFVVPKKRLNGKLEFGCYVIVSKDIQNYTNKGLNSDYQGHTINLKKGELLVAYRPSIIPLDIDLKNIRNPKSFITVRKNPNESATNIVFSLDSPKIQILMPDEMYDKYTGKKLAQQEMDTLRASIYLQALTFALLQYSKYKKENYVWVTTLSFRLREDAIRNSFDVDSILEEGSLDEEEIFKLAQVMLNNPYDELIGKMAERATSVGNIIEH